MNVGDLVVRAYTWHSLVPGIIVEEEISIITEADESDAYEICNFTVQWSDGTQTLEMYEELEPYEDMVKKINLVRQNDTTNPITP